MASTEYKAVPMQEIPLSGLLHDAKKHDGVSHDSVADAAANRQNDLEAGIRAPTAATEVRQRPATNASFIRMAALCGLVIQNSALVLTMKQASLMPASDGKKALTTTVVVMVEFFKVSACVLEIMYRRRSSGGVVAELREEVFQKPNESLMLLVPAFLYLAQNNLLFVAVANLEAVVYQVVAQLKILSTAGFSIVILGRKLSVQQWCALVILTVGCAVVQIDGTNSGNTKPARVGTSPALGLTCALMAICTSGFAGVFVEKMLKTTSNNMSVRNIQLGVPALVLGLLGVLASDGSKLEDGFFQGYTHLTWIVVCLHSGGGLLVTVIIKYADNIAKTIAVAISLVVSTALSIYLFDFVLTVHFAAGSALVVSATFLYSHLCAVCPTATS
eukprot:Tamp_20085.p1 GENE.Tamp_20085~~Tamp_20085.p1  ORF type:complete len:400 (+),score=77.68 Tamp_20085:39-1202(+)